jgi:hypothetical protein
MRFWKSIVAGLMLAGISAAINLATGQGGILWWVISLVLVVSSAVIGVFLEEGWPRPHLRLWIVAVLGIGGVVLLSGDSRMAPYETPALPGVTAGRPPATSPPVAHIPPPRYVTEPNDIDPDTQAVEARMTRAVREASLIPAGVKIESRDGQYDPPFQFNVRQGEFLAEVRLVDEKGSSILSISVQWADPKVGLPECRSDETSYCGITPMRDGTKVYESIIWNKGGATQNVAVNAFRPDGTVVGVSNMNFEDGDLRITRKDVPLSSKQLSAIATLKDLTLTS